VLHSDQGQIAADQGPEFNPGLIGIVEIRVHTRVLFPFNRAKAAIRNWPGNGEEPL